MTTPTAPTRDVPAFATIPTAVAAVADLAMTAAQRMLALQVELIEGLVGLSIARSRRAVADPAGAMRDALLGPSGFEPAWRYATGIATVGQQALASLASVATAQAHGAAAELDELSRDAKDAASRSALEVASATRAALDHGLAAIGRLADEATRATLRSPGDAPAPRALRAVPRPADAAGASASGPGAGAAQRPVGAGEGRGAGRPAAARAGAAPKPPPRPARSGASRGAARTGPVSQPGRPRRGTSPAPGRGRGGSRGG